MIPGPECRGEGNAAEQMRKTDCKKTTARQPTARRLTEATLRLVTDAVKLLGSD